MMMSHTISARPRITIVDPCSAKGYDLTDLCTGGVGGTEATILRVARAISPEIEVTICQKGRCDTTLSEAGRLLPLDAALLPRMGDAPDALVVINRWKVALKLRKIYPGVPIHLWLHVYPGRHNRKMGAALRDAEIPVICVSQTHARLLAEFLGPAAPRITAIYNPIPDDLHPEASPRDPSRLLYASSPHKGLREVFGQFAALRQKMPQLTLAIADPGYLAWDTGPVPEGVVNLGSLSHGDLLREMRRAMCLFYPQTSFAETFGLVIAEANAVGTPALLHRDVGANAEVAGHLPAQLIDGRNGEAIAARIADWHATPPKVAANPEFRLGAVARCWTRRLGAVARTGQESAA